MSKLNPAYDFKWCPGCGDFGVRKALDAALQEYKTLYETPYSQSVIIAGIGCSGNLVHLMEEEQPFGLHGIHGRTLPLALGVKMSRPDLNTVIVAGDGDFLSIGAEHIGPAAQRNLDTTCVIMDNAVYGLTKGQSSPTSSTGQITSSTPYGKIEIPMHPLKIYLAYGATYVASHYSVKPRELAKCILEAMNHKGFAIVHVQSPCTTYNDTYDLLKGNRKKGIASSAWLVPDEHDPSDLEAAEALVKRPGIPIGLIYQIDKPTLEDMEREAIRSVIPKSPKQLIDSYSI